MVPMAEALPPRRRCPRCNRWLEAAGEITSPEGLCVLAYQCDECIQPIKLGNEMFDVAATWWWDGKQLVPGTEIE